MTQIPQVKSRLAQRRTHIPWRVKLWWWIGPAEQIVLCALVAIVGGSIIAMCVPERLWISIYTPLMILAVPFQIWGMIKRWREVTGRSKSPKPKPGQLTKK